MLDGLRARLDRRRPARSRGGPATSGRRSRCRTAGLRPRRRMPASGLRLPDGVSNARSPPKLSEVASPSATSSPSASSTCGPQQMRGLRELVEEQRASRGEAVEDRLRAGARARRVRRGRSDIQSGSRRRSMRAIGVEPTGAGARARPLATHGRGQTRPGRPAGETKRVEPGWLVALQASRQNFRLPRPGRGFEPFQRGERDRQRVGPLKARLIRRHAARRTESEGSRARRPARSPSAGAGWCNDGCGPAAGGRTIARC